MPGDFSASFEKNGITLGIVGLNTAFLHLIDQEEGKLAIDVRQFNSVCRGEGPDWLYKHHLSLLMTHHPPSWLREDAKAQLNEIYGQERFALHLFGHLHEPAHRSLAELRGPFRHRLQGYSFFSVTRWGINEKERLHGYTLGQFKIEDNSCEYRLWPRKAIQRQDGGWDIDKDPGYRYPKGEKGTVPIPILIRNIPKNRFKYQLLEILSNEPWLLDKTQVEVIDVFEAKIVGEEGSDYMIEFKDSEMEIVEAKLPKKEFSKHPCSKEIGMSFGIVLYIMQGNTMIGVWPIEKYWNKSLLG